jgi:prephenate dehydrogenase
MSSKILIIGLDQVGATIGLALVRAEGDVLRLGFDPDKKIAKAAKAANAVDRLVAHPRQAVESADLIIFALPHYETEAYLKSLGPKTKPEAVILDTGSIKAPFFRWAEQHLPADRAYIGATPVVGNPDQLDEDTSIRLDRFSGGLLAITAPAKTPQRALAIAINLAKILDAQPFFLDVDEQDSAAALSEDLPTLLSAAMIQSAANSPSWRELQRMAGSLFVKTTEPCSVNPKQLQKRVAANREKILARIQSFSEELGRIREILMTEQDDELMHYFEQANSARSSWLLARARGDWAAEELPKIPDVDTNLVRQLLGLGKRKPKTDK